MVDATAFASALAERVDLAIDGRLYGGWTGVSVTRSLESLCGAFSLTLADKGDAAAAPVAIRAGDRCQLGIGGDVVIDGWVDAVSASGSADDHSITVSGRDRTADLADCSAIHSPGSWRVAKIETIAAELAKPFGISVTAKVSTGAPVARFALQQGESFQAAIERLLRFRGLLMVAGPTGDLEIVRPDDGAPVATLELGVNILTWSGTTDHGERYSEYRIKGQAAGDDGKHGKTVAAIKGVATDPDVTRYRPLLIVAEDQSDGASAATRAKWEAGVRAGKAVSVEIATLGWRVAAGGALWRPNTRVRLVCPPARIADEVLLVTAVSISRDDGGTITALTLAPPGAWTQIAEPERAS